MTTAILEKPTAWDIAMDLEVILTTLRVTNEMMLEQLCHVLPNELESVAQTHERLFVLMEMIPSKLEELEELYGALVTLHRESKGPSNLT